MTIDGDKLKAIRLARGLTQEELASRSGYGIRTLRRIERGQAQPRPRTLREIAQALGVEAGDLLPAPSPAEDGRRTSQSQAAEGRAAIQIRVEHGQEDARSCALAGDLNAELARRLSRTRVLDVSTAEPSEPAVSSIEERWRTYDLATRVRIQGNRVRVWIELSDARTQQMLWSDRFDLVEASLDLIELSDRASEHIFARLHTELLDAEVTRSVPMGAQPLAWDEMMHALRVALKKTPDGIEEGIERLDALLRVHPDFFPACASLANLLPYDFRTRDPEHAVVRALDLAERCVRLDPRYVPGQTALAAICTVRGEHARARAHAQLALDLEPLYAPAHRVLAEVLIGIGRAKESLEAAEEAIRLTPDWDPLLFEALLVHGVGLFAAGDPVQASGAIERSISAVAAPHAQLWLAVCLAAQGRLDDARAAHGSLPGDVSVETICTLRGIPNQAHAARFNRVLATLRAT